MKLFSFLPEVLWKPKRRKIAFHTFSVFGLEASTVRALGRRPRAPVAHLYESNNLTNDWEASISDLISYVLLRSQIKKFSDQNGTFELANRDSSSSRYICNKGNFLFISELLLCRDVCTQFNRKMRHSGSQCDSLADVFQVQLRETSAHSASPDDALAWEFRSIWKIYFRLASRAHRASGDVWCFLLVMYQKENYRRKTKREQDNSCDIHAGNQGKTNLYFYSDLIAAGTVWSTECFSRWAHASKYNRSNC